LQTNALSEDPRSYQEAFHSPNWKDKWKPAFDKELQSIIDNGCFEEVILPAGKKAIDGKWVFKTKTGANGEIIKYKARLVVRGFQQVEGVDYFETYAPVVKFDSLRLIIALAARDNLFMHQLDVETAFLNGELEEEVFMQIPEGVRGKPGYVWRLLKSLYGLKQAPRTWYSRLHKVLLKYGFLRCISDNGVYVKWVKGHILIFTVYVDDFIIVCKIKEFIIELREFLSVHFKITDLGDAKYILGIQIIRDRDTGVIKLSQRQYVKEVLEKFNMGSCKPVKTPLDSKVKFVKADESERVDVPYREAIGSLMYLSVGTRPDIAAAVSMLSRYSNCPGKSHWEGVKRVMRYLAGTQDLGICFESGTGGELHGYCDSDHGGDLDSGRSTSGYAFLFGNGAISWSSKLQPTVATSSTEAEYMAAGHAVKQCIWVRELMSELKLDVGRTVIYTDNMSSIALIKNPVHHQRTKHIRINWHFIREVIESGEMEFEFVPSSEQAADMLTKAALGEVYEVGREILGLR
jgi:ribonuclease HI